MGDGVRKKRRISRKTCDKPHYPFQLPEGWCFCCINDIAESLLGKTLDKSKDKGVPKEYLCAINVQWGRFDFSILKSFLIGENEFQRYSVKQGDLMVCEGGDVGRCAIWEENEREMYYQNALHRIRCEYGISNYFLQYALWYYKLNGTIDYLCKGVTIKHFTQTTMSKLAIPLPPSNEQKRIVDEIQRLFSIIDKVEERKDNLQLTIRQTKSKILDLAIHGKLVPQAPTDKPASELLKRINPKAEIACDNPQYENLPNGWCECTLGSLFLFIRNGINIRQDKSKIGYPITRIETISSEFIDRSRMGYAAITEENYSDYYLQKDDILMSHINSPIHVGKCALCDIKAGEKIIHGMNLLCLRPYPDIEAKFILMVFRSPYFKNEIRPFIKNAVNQASINIRNLSSVHLYLPPVSEQNRIVAKIEELFTQLDKIEVSL